ncbi:Zinc finger protein 534 [Portunus trituberculatus]|uniref:Zinc finger protein 534 n=1 Tax=Portunus trituberculatus TaxID=210409 RepID=A0A5B7G105_PORTR|nr:Zinc finger protein 534 [Portunus trituberculatus]
MCADVVKEPQPQPQPQSQPHSNSRMEEEDSSMKVEDDSMAEVRKFECEECGEILNSRSKFIQHSLSHRGVSVFCCQNCEQLFYCEKQLEQHISLHMKQDRDLTRHTNIHTQAKIHVCEECGRTFTHRSSFKQHMNIHTRAEQFSCDECDKVFYQKASLVKHKNIHAGIKYACDECDKHFNEKSHLKRHKNVHTRTLKGENWPRATERVKQKAHIGF